MGKLLITSGGYLDGQRSEDLDERIEELSANKKVLIVTNATATGSNIKGVPIIKQNLEQHARQVDCVRITEENIKMVHSYDLLYFTGGDLAPLAKIVTDNIRTELLNFLSGEGSIIGEGAGSIIFGNNFKWYYDVKKGTKPKYDVELPSYDGFGFINYEIYPHYNKTSNEQKKKLIDYNVRNLENVDLIQVMEDGEFYEENVFSNLNTKNS